ncbi:phosphoribosyltransferase [Devosia sp.]|uniref:phosphoribosyltransferase n=1 Tax=Devosia sp. TaxID=1871048 RepID=UPI00345BE385
MSPLEPHHFWQTIDPTDTHDSAPADGFTDSYPTRLPDGRQLLLPLRVLPGDGTQAVASLIVNQASFAVEDALSQAMTELIAPLAPEVIIGVPTLGLPLANNVARRLGHPRMVALGTSRKFWYVDALSAPMSSITSPTHQKTIFLDPRSLPLLANKRVVVVDDVISSGTSIVAVLTLLAQAGITPVAVVVAMLQGTRWHTPLAAHRDKIVAPIASPRFARTPNGHWLPD